MKPLKNLERRVELWWFYLSDTDKEAVKFCAQVLAITIMAFFFLVGLYFAAVEYQEFLNSNK